MIAAVDLLKKEYMKLFNSPKAEGHGAYLTGKGCPYESGSRDYDLWMEGFKEAERRGSKAPENQQPESK